MDAVAKIQALGLRVWWSEQAGEAAAEVGGAREIRLVCGVGTAQGEDAGQGGDLAEDLLRLLRSEREGLGELERGGHSLEIVAGGEMEG